MITPLTKTAPAKKSSVLGKEVPTASTGRRISAGGSERSVHTKKEPSDKRAKELRKATKAKAKAEKKAAMAEKKMARKKRKLL